MEFKGKVRLIIIAAIIFVGLDAAAIAYIYFQR